MEHPSYYRAVLAFGVVGMTALGLQGCATSGEGGAEAPPRVADETATFPDPEEAWVDGTYANVENLRNMQQGLSKDQTYDLIGRPHFSEGLFGVHEWNYVFHLPAGDGSYMTCQYQVTFDDDMLADSLRWRDGECAALLEPRSSTEPTRLTLSGDTLFEFDSARLSPRGRQQVNVLANRIRSDFTAPEVMVLGHTDRLGSGDYNQALSERRAATVRSALVSNGIAPSSIRSRGFGERQPVTRCEGTRATPGLKACLQPNRRVDIEVSETG
ncbi:OmpA family protein [Halomonas organivorans]|uniref:Outer membrane protein OmpA-like peptidoglycan-associated protein n=1 Tax=Halomonas organivorans TaxID=257772 RepID=A0A7W5BZH0_9GAMM|nr:OmpA family protein [Halomonas organivorans]MBB3141945.1 outer membrane protein OmpA-like peptidoglycan-associated protein [Halomonas organivorans]